jgi:hypothetical protein
MFDNGQIYELRPVSQLPGDYNDDGAVDAADYVVWRENSGTTNSLPNDAIGGMIGPAHYDQWRANFGDSAGEAGTLAQHQIPEPTTVALLFVLLVVLRRRFHS